MYNYHNQLENLRNQTRSIRHQTLYVICEYIQQTGTPLELSVFFPPTVRLIVLVTLQNLIRINARRGTNI